jgi:hypothetical protein
MDDLLTRFKEARRALLDMQDRLSAEQERRADLWRYDRSEVWDSYLAALAAFQRVAGQLADYLLGVE